MIKNHRPKFETKVLEHQNIKTPRHQDIKTPRHLTLQKNLLFSLGILSAAVIAFQLALMQILSFVQWHHFAYMVISVALLGFGAAGAALAIFRKWLMKRFEWLPPLLMILAGLAMALAVGISQTAALRFDSYLLFAKPAHAWRLLAAYLLFFIPFFLSALAIGMVFVRFAGQIGTLYFANLLGSGAGSLAALGLIRIYFPGELPAVIAIFPLISGMLLISRARRGLLAAAALFATGIIAFRIVSPPQLALSEFKSLSKTLNLPQARILLEKTGPHGVIQVVSSPAIRYAPGLSLNYRGLVPVSKAIFINGNWGGAVRSRARTDTSDVLDFTGAALPHAMRPRERVLALCGAAGGEIGQALAAGARQITVAEPNSALLSILRNELAGELDSLLDHPAVRVRNLEPRTFLMADTAAYDLVLLPMVGEFGGAAGLYALQEQYLFTREAFREMRRRLTPEGVIAVSCWMDYPLRNPLKLLAALAEALEAEGIADPENHIAAVRSWATITFAVKSTPLDAGEIARIGDFCAAMGFDPALLPGVSAEQRERFNRLQNRQFFEYLDEILSPEREKLYAEYDFNLRPPGDDRPYFSQFLRWKSLPHLRGLFGEQALPFFEIGYLLAALTLLQITVIALALIILPLFFRSQGVLDRAGGGFRQKNGRPGRRLLRTGNKLRIFFYFSGIGLGYMFVEIVFIQRFILYFGSPVYAAAAAIASLLVCSGAGSYLSARLPSLRRALIGVPGGIMALLLVYAVVLTPALRATIALPAGIKLLLALLFIAPLGFFMGMPFPLGLRRFREEFSGLTAGGEDEVPWAWGINGCVSVVSAALAAIVAVELGFTWVMIFAAAGYGVTLLAGWKDIG